MARITFAMMKVVRRLKQSISPGRKHSVTSFGVYKGCVQGDDTF
jgi:hypothetical protein